MVFYINLLTDVLYFDLMNNFWYNYSLCHCLEEKYFQKWFIKSLSNCQKIAIYNKTISKAVLIKLHKWNCFIRLECVQKRVWISVHCTTLNKHSKFHCIRRWLCNSSVVPKSVRLYYNLWWWIAKLLQDIVKINKLLFFFCMYVLFRIQQIDFLKTDT